MSTDNLDARSFASQFQAQVLESRPLWEQDLDDMSAQQMAELWEEIGSDKYDVSSFRDNEWYMRHLRTALHKAKLLPTDRLRGHGPDGFVSFARNPMGELYVDRPEDGPSDPKPEEIGGTPQGFTGGAVAAYESGLPITMHTEAKREMEAATGAELERWAALFGTGRGTRVEDATAETDGHLRARLRAIVSSNAAKKREQEKLANGRLPIYEDEAKVFKHLLRRATGKTLESLAEDLEVERVCVGDGLGNERPEDDATFAKRIMNIVHARTIKNPI